MKSMWLRDHQPEAWSRERHLVGSKDYINLLLTGELATDHSYASGSGAYDLSARRYDSELLDAAGLPGSTQPLAMNMRRKVPLRAPLEAKSHRLCADLLETISPMMVRDCCVH